MLSAVLAMELWTLLSDRVPAAVTQTDISSALPSVWFSSFYCVLVDAMGCPRRVATGERGNAKISATTKPTVKSQSLLVYLWQSFLLKGGLNHRLLVLYGGAAGLWFTILWFCLWMQTVV